MVTPDDQILAAELALGLLDGADRDIALKRLRTDAYFSAEVAWWRDRAWSLSLELEAVEVPGGLLKRVERDIDRPATSLKPRGWTWFASGALGGALAASLAAMLIVPAPRVEVRPEVAATPVNPPLVAVLVPAEPKARAPFAAVLDRRSRTLRLTATIEIPQGRAAELWRIGRDGVPIALGVLSRGSRASLRIGEGALPRADETIAISIEPAQGSPSGKPTGPVIASGALIAI
jgi:anti-sigma-K factor RskA